MGTINDLIQRLLGMLKWWVTVMPWDTGLRVRLGRHVTLLSPGVFLRIPVIDAFFIQSNRLRMFNLPVQTMTTRDGVTLTLSAAVGFAIGDIRKLYDTIQHPEDTLGNLVLSYIAEYIAEHDKRDCEPRQLQETVNTTLCFDKYGLKDGVVYVTDFAFVKTYRLINDSRWSTFTNFGNGLNTSIPVST